MKDYTVIYTQEDSPHRWEFFFCEAFDTAHARSLMSARDAYVKVIGVFEADNRPDAIAQAARHMGWGRR